MDNKGQVFILLGITAAIVGVIVLSISMPILNDFIDDTSQVVDDPTAIALGLLPVFLVVALIVRMVRTTRGEQVSIG